MKRESGYYWVNFSGNYYIALYYAVYDYWEMIGHETIYHDLDYDEIGKERIESSRLWTDGPGNNFIEKIF